MNDISFYFSVDFINAARPSNAPMLTPATYIPAQTERQPDPVGEEAASKADPVRIESIIKTERFKPEGIGV